MSDSLLKKTIKPVIPLRIILDAWWPLWASWIMMSIGSPLSSAFIARLPDPAVNLAAFGSVANAIGGVIVAPQLMLLSASVALSKDWNSYCKLRKFVMVSSGLLTLVHVLIAFTPLYDVIVTNIIGAPAELVEPGRLAFRIEIPWTLAVAYRRFQQGVMIRFGHSRTVGTGTIIRLLANVVVLWGTSSIDGFSGAAVGASAHVAGMVAEAIYSGFSIKPILRYEMKLIPNAEKAMSWREFAAYYFPLAATTILGIFVQPVGSAALSRMPDPLTSLAVWPIITGILSGLRASGTAFNEVVVAYIDRPGSYKNLSRFTGYLSGGIIIMHLVIAATPLSYWFFHNLSALSDELTDISMIAFWLSLPVPVITTLISWYQGAILASKKTKSITESIVISFVVFLVVMIGGMVSQSFIGVYFAIAALILSSLAQMLWLWHSSKPMMEKVRLRDVPDAEKNPELSGSIS